MFDYLAQYRMLAPQIDEAIHRVLKSGRLILGPEVEAFEDEFSEFLGGSGFSIGVGNGTDAVAIALRALEVGPEDEVVTVSNTAVPTVSAIREAGATPVFCDVDERTGLMDLDLLDSCLTQRTKAVVAVHLFGNVVDIPRLRTIISGRDVAVVEDCAQAHGAMLNGVMAGTMGDVGAFSFYPTKNLGAYGDGGMCFTKDRGLAGRIRSIRMYGFEGQHYSVREGVNSRLDELQAAVLRVKLQHLPEYIQRRRAIAERYDTLLGGVVTPVVPGPGVLHAYHLYVVRTAQREKLRAALKESGVGSAVHYPYAIHRMEAYCFLGYGEGALPVTEKLAGEILSLPMYPELSFEDVSFVCEAVRCVLD
ncbi:MAG TPA: DegT/DnrJ/EryC1/StrS family aminotransferase, partial [Gammaproteobacteria bacterium]|nr:DegT/DnrJ/EryC1/StrS family aminotransferase [Gammaproteobacteria bacterium]